MKKIFYLASCIVTIIGLVSCGSKSDRQGVKFAPKEETESMSVEERAEKIAALKNQKLLNAQSLLNPHDIQISIIIPTVKGRNEFPEIGERLATKMLAMAAENGISGLGVSSSFVLGAEINQIGSEVTSTAPQRTIVKYDIAYKVMNAADGAVYAACNQEISGVGSTFREAEINAVSNVKNTPKFQKMLALASKRIIEWYNDNLPTLKQQVEAARGNGDYPLALSLIRAVPQQAAEAHQYASEIQPKLFEEYLTKEANANLQSLIAMIASSNEDFNPQIGGYFSLIPVDSPQFKEAKLAYEKYETKCKARLTELEAKAERDSAAAREMEILRMNLNNQKELAQIEADKIVGQAEAKANAKAMGAEKKGFWGKLGDRVLGGIDAMSDKFGWDD